jgi:hypothetical protein
MYIRRPQLGLGGIAISHHKEERVLEIAGCDKRGTNV